MSKEVIDQLKKISCDLDEMISKDADLPEGFEPISEFAEYAEASSELQTLFGVPEEQLGIQDGHLVVEVATEPFCVYLHAPINPEGVIDWSDSKYDIPSVEEKINTLLEPDEEAGEEAKETEEVEIGQEAEGGPKGD